MTKSHIQWNTYTGKATEVSLIQVPCPDSQHHDAYMDEYGSWRYCRTCSNNMGGHIYRRVHTRRPEYDAPTPKK